MIKDGVYEIKHAEMIQKTHVRLLSLEEIRDIMHFVGFTHVQMFTKVDSPYNAILAQKQ